MAMPVEELSDDFFELTQSLMDHHGMPAYEVSNHAEPGKECRHNMIYWHYQDYIGVGPGAHGRLTDDQGKRWASVQMKTPEAWLKNVEGGNLGPDQVTQIEQADLVFEMMMMGLRIREGINLAAFQQITGMSLSAAIPDEKIVSLCEEGYCRLTPDSLKMTMRGLKNVNAILRYMFD
jgi:oxygen-independent coproporphyrinogen-3 oxidase